MTHKKTVNESAATGAVSAHSVAVRADAGGSHPHGIKKRTGLLDFLSSYQSKKLGNRLNMKQVDKPFKVSIKEDVSLDQIYSKMSGIENSGRRDEDDSVTYGVEDDNGNLMKITVRGDQGEDFEVALAQELGEVEEYQMTGRGGHGRDVSMAEVLFNLKQKFDIIDVEFPEIPTDKVYNADKVSDPSELESEFDTGEDDFDMGEEDDTGLDMEGGEGDMEGMGDEGEGGDEFDFDPNSEDDESEEGEEDLDSDIGQELGDEEEDEESMLKQIVKMMSADAEAKKAQHEAEAEKYRAMQAEYTMKAAKEEMYKQEELLKMEEEQEKQKNKEKEAKKMADLARYKLRGAVSESANPASFLSVLSELNDLEDETSLRMQRRNVRDIEDPRERALQTQILNNKRRILQRRKAAQLQQKQTDQDQDGEQEEDQDRQQPRKNEPVPNRRPIGGSNV